MVLGLSGAVSESNFMVGSRVQGSKTSLASLNMNMEEGCDEYVEIPRSLDHCLSFWECNITMVVSYQMGRLKARQQPPGRRRPGPWDPLPRTGLSPVDFLYDMRCHAPLNLRFLFDMVQMRSSWGC